MEPLILSSLEGLELLLEPDGELRLREAHEMLVGRLITDKSLYKSVVKDILARARGLNEELNISDLGPNVFPFNFAEAKEARRVLDEGTWYVMGCLLSLQSWIPEAFVHEGFGSQGRIYQRFGSLLNMKDYRAFVIIVVFLGHDNRKCKSSKEMAVYNQSRPRYGPTLAQAKSLAAIAAENSMRIRRIRSGDDNDVSQEKATSDTSMAQQREEVKQNDEEHTVARNEAGGGHPTTGTTRGQGAKEGAKSGEGLTADSVGPRGRYEATFLFDSIPQNNPLNKDLIRGTNGKSIQGTNLAHNPPSPNCPTHTHFSRVNHHTPLASIYCVDLEKEKRSEVESKLRGRVPKIPKPNPPPPQQNPNRPAYYVEFPPEEPDSDDSGQAAVRNITEDFNKYASLKRGRPNDQLYLTTGEDDGGGV
ncbi:hypothetical protein SESBI_31558 [Sesbania bispinosa]|nr:hypothetical protein SESBI_31558 [Sesbania bispinosa]